MYKKLCPVCNKEQTYKWKFTYDNAIKKNIRCSSCANKTSSKIRPQNQKGYHTGKQSGANNPMFGKTIFDVWNEKYDVETVELLKKQHAEKSRRVGKDAGMYGKSLMDIWVEKYGQEEAEKRYSNWASKMGRFGEKNPAYGKPAHKLAGRGIKGWLYGIFFRSLLEMQYIYYCIQKGDTIVGAETNEYRTQYIDDSGNQKTYHPDFLINGVKIVEIKPTTLINRNINKINAAKLRFGENYSVETEKTFPSLVDLNLFNALLLNEDLKIADKDRVMKNIKRWKYKCR